MGSKLSPSFVKGVEQAKCSVAVVLLTNKLGWGLVVVLCGVGWGGDIPLQIQIYFTFLEKKISP